MVKFEDVPGISKETLRALTEVFKFESASAIQAATLPVTLRGSDVFAKAKTGGGKTLAFLIPALEALRRNPACGVGALIVTPTRELALQISAEAEQLIKFSPDVEIIAAVGGTSAFHNKAEMGRALKRSSVIIVGTPGRRAQHQVEAFLMAPTACLLLASPCTRCLPGSSSLLRSYLILFVSATLC